ncbi:Rieske 2Fe-2S domain-containing protein [Halorubellus sp. PRR65]|uniref:Rieske (2Fe-2S) protein n=1 Tax=Halorubellus sp. PRR65 TaxID=3098148 RepID=UPI002B257FF9|nr:Rieske 2Fe-2S domain-containing protein [Halorubellus sp. PRR65]
MSARTRVTSVESVHEDGSYLFAVRDSYGDDGEVVVVVPCEDGVAAFRNYCVHESDQRLAREGVGAVVRDGGMICPRHGSTFDTCSGDCDNGKAEGMTLADVDVVVEDGQVYLVDDSLTYLYEGPVQGGDDDGDEMPSSTSHINL